MSNCSLRGTRYGYLGYQGRQARDRTHLLDLVSMFREYYQAARPIEAYNIGGHWAGNCSMKKAINLCESRSSKKMDLVYTDNNCISDHIWYISDTRKFQSHDLVWKQTHELPGIVDEIFEIVVGSRWAAFPPLVHV